MDRQMVLLVNVPKGVLGEGASALLAAFIVAHLQKAALSRTSTTNRPPYYLYLDEFQHYTTDNIQDILSESRKYALSLTLAHQYLDQLPGSLHSAVLNTAGTVVCFRTGYHDAARLAKEIFPSSDFIQTIKTDIKLRSNGLLSLPFIDNKLVSSGWEGLALEIAGLKPRQFWYRRRGPYKPFKQTTFNMPDPLMTPGLVERIQRLRDYSGARYARPKSAVSQTSQVMSDQRVDIPLWSD